MKESFKKEIAFERVLFFSDAIVAIAITLLALNLKLEIPSGQHLSFADLLRPWKTILAFVLSFINIANFWKTHHDFFIYINRLDRVLVLLNIAWLFLIVVLPFSTTVVSSYFGDSPAIFLYSLNVLLITILQNLIWDYAALRKNFLSPDIAPEQQRRYALMCNLDMANGAIAVVLSFFHPTLAFVLLFTKVPLFLIGALYILQERRKEIYRDGRPRSRPPF
ncbi:Uncharacterized membrane protein [Flexibacter flexilis DSM 6793]|uniref:Uncharacterized membrane protein n=1 Tax=Flexibacter flexilis DSM 6793 TaxID=927664 RepID=A0A1I1FNZ9_9BACT|nr:TMEM175 family protein [Flexibacter flexilis]SFC00726.1 Uncharacterized membrane protein [Flexibacter flexilis DSM 6793]